jgi:hypothetical protein
MLRILLLASLTAGCSSGSYTDFTNPRNALLCQIIFDCCSPSQQSMLAPGDTDATSCTNDLNSQSDTNYKDGVDKGAIKYDSGAGQRCLAAYQASLASCDSRVDLVGELADCANALTGTTGTGGDCLTDFECVTADYCVLGNGAGVIGKCTARALKGQPCGGTPCVYGLTCGLNNTCDWFSKAGDMCAANSQCASNSCTGDVNSPHTCTDLQTAQQYECGM